MDRTNFRRNINKSNYTKPNTPDTFSSKVTFTQGKPNLHQFLKIKNLPSERDSIMSPRPASSNEDASGLRTDLVKIRKTNKKLKRIIEKHIDKEGTDNFERSKFVITTREQQFSSQAREFAQ
jgi:hypothetical protein